MVIRLMTCLIPYHWTDRCHGPHQRADQCHDPHQWGDQQLRLSRVSEVNP